MLAGPRSHLVDIVGGHFGQYPTNVDSHHRFLEALLQLQFCVQLNAGLEYGDRLLLPAMGRGCTSTMQTWRKRLLGHLFLLRQEVVNLPNSCLRLGRTDHLHLGRFCVHVHRSLDGHTTPCQAQETVESRPRWSIKSEPHNSASPLSGIKFGICGHDARLWRYKRRRYTRNEPRVTALAEDKSSFSS